MSAIILRWNPDRWNDWNYASVVLHVRESGQFVHEWSVGRRRRVAAGADAWLLLQSRQGPGLIGHGRIVSGSPYAATAGPETSAMSVLVAFDSLLSQGDQVTVDVLEDRIPAVPWKRGFGSGMSIDAADESKIRDLWREFGPEPFPDPTQPVPGTYPQAAISRVDVNRYERNAEARRLCLAHYGTNCAACGFSFEMVYGEIGKDFIQVHHVVPVSELGSGYELDPITDLVPLCANCHAMAHRGVTTPRTPSELRRIIGAAGYLQGQVIEPVQIEALRDARRIMGATSE